MPGLTKEKRKLLQDRSNGRHWRKMESTRTNTSRPIDLLEGIVLETGARLIKWKVILTRTGKLFANIHHWKLKMAQRILDIPQQYRGWSVRQILWVALAFTLNESVSSVLHEGTIEPTA